MNYSKMSVEAFAARMTAGCRAAQAAGSRGERTMFATVLGRTVLCTVNVVTGAAVRAAWSDGTPVHIVPDAAGDAARAAECEWQSPRLLAYACGGIDLDALRAEVVKGLPRALQVVGAA